MLSQAENSTNLIRMQAVEMRGRAASCNGQVARHGRLGQDQEHSLRERYWSFLGLSLHSLAPWSFKTSVVGIFSRTHILSMVGRSGIDCLNSNISAYESS